MNLPGPWASVNLHVHNTSTTLPARVTISVTPSGGTPAFGPKKDQYHNRVIPPDGDVDLTGILVPVNYSVMAVATLAGIMSVRTRYSYPS